jgi:major histocompatibility complex class I
MSGGGWRQIRDPGQAIRSKRTQGVVAHTFNPSTREAEAGGFLSSRPAWSTE